MGDKTRPLPNKKVVDDARVASFTHVTPHDLLAIAGQENAAPITHRWQGSSGLERQIAKIGEVFVFGPVYGVISRLGTFGWI